MRRAVPAVAAGLLLAGPTVLAFRSGGYFAEPRLVAALVAWLLVLALAVAGPAPLPCGRAGRVALAGLVLLIAWSALSIAWAPLRGPAQESVQRLVLYTGALMVAVGALPAALRAVEPALAAGASVVIGYGLSGRLLPGLIELDRSRSAGGRLEQPITYWNAEGALAAVGLLLCARLIGDRSRPTWLRVAAAAASAPLGAGVYLSYSRGAIAVAVLGLVLLVAALPDRAQLRASLTAFGAGAAASVAAAAFPGVAALEGSHPERDGAAVLVLLALVAVAAAGFTALRPASGRPLPRPRRLAPVAGVIVALFAAGLVVAGLGERPSDEELAAGAGATRLTTVSSNRYEYWRVGADAFAREPLTGLGAGGFRVEWLRERPLPEAVRDAHSLEVEVAAELGLPGLIALALFAGGVTAAGLGALTRRRALAAGPAVALLAWFLHASIDWDWQLPAVTLPAIALAGALIVLADDEPDVELPAAPARARRASAAPAVTDAR